MERNKEWRKENFEEKLVIERIKDRAYLKISEEKETNNKHKGKNWRKND